MKQLILLLLVSSFTFAQSEPGFIEEYNRRSSVEQNFLDQRWMEQIYQDQYNHWSIEPSFGITKVRDITSFGFGNIDLGVRYMFVPALGARLNFSRTNSIEDFTGVSFMGVVNLARLMQIEQSLAMKRVTILGSLGGMYTDFRDVPNSVILHRRSGFHITSRFEIVYKISNNFSFDVGLHNTVGVNSRPFRPESTETTSIININAGLIVGLGNRNKVHADWYIREPREEYDPGKELRQLEQRIDSLDSKFRNFLLNFENNTYITENGNNQPEYLAFHFDHDRYDLIQSDILIVEKLVLFMKENPDTQVLLQGYASPPGTEGYNKGLAKIRADTIAGYLIDKGISKERIRTETIGEEGQRPEYRLHPFGRSVHVIIQKK